MIEEKLSLINDYNLRYINENNLCFQRRRRGKGFVYVNAGGKIIKDQNVLNRFKSLVIPPAWENVFICDDDRGHIQAVGRDSRGRKQYIYHQKWEEFSSINKFSRMIDFAENLPAIRKRIHKDLRKKSLFRNKVLAVIVKLMQETLIRVGNEIYAEQNNSYGLTTLKDKHIQVNGFTISFQFNGKGGKPFNLELRNKTLARIVKKCQDLPGQQLFQYIDETGKLQPIESADVNNYLNSIVEKNFTAKDFRTWGATVLAAEKLNELPLSDNEKENNRNIVEAIKYTSKGLNNTPSICRRYYVHPYILEAYLDGYLFKAFTLSKESKSKYGLNKSEKAVERILKKYALKKNGNGKLLS